MAMAYLSTRPGAARVRFIQTLLTGLAPGGGLYMPERYPHFSDEALDTLRASTYVEVAQSVALRYIGDIEKSDIRAVIEKTYTSEMFGSPEIVPVNKFQDGFLLLRLSEGPSYAFKDLGLQALGNFMEFVLGAGEVLVLLGATSGDTGAAAIRAIENKKNIILFVLSPEGRMSRFQQADMYTSNAPNIVNLAVQGVFDDCQDMVKAIMPKLRALLGQKTGQKKFRVSGVNSINWARILFQVVYHLWGSLRATENNSERVDISVPTGNCGNIVAAHIAREMGAPIRNIIVASNENDVFAEFFRTGVYRPRPKNKVVPTWSPSMDIGEGSNFERLVFDWTLRDEKLLAQLWKKLQEEGRLDLSAYPFFRNGRGVEGFLSGTCTDKETLQVMRWAYHCGTGFIDPHTAVALKVGLEHRSPDVPLLVAETASPVKFDDAVRKATGRVPERLQTLQDLEERKDYAVRIPANAQTAMEVILSRLPYLSS